MELICTYLDEAYQIEEFLHLRGVEVEKIANMGNADVILSVPGRLSPAFIKTFWEWINDRKFKVEVRHV